MKNCIATAERERERERVKRHRNGGCARLARREASMVNGLPMCMSSQSQQRGNRRMAEITNAATIAAAEASPSDTVEQIIPVRHPTPLDAIDEEREASSSGMPPNKNEKTEAVRSQMSMETKGNTHGDDDDSCCCSSHAPTEKTSLANQTTTTTEATAAIERLSPLQHNKCRVCARLGYRPRHPMDSLVFHSMEVLDIDFGMFELVRRIDEDHDYRVDRDVAIQTADMAVKHVKHFRKKLTEAGLLQQQGQNFVGESSHVRVMAPFEKSEIQIGRLLGSGGFSSVYEVEVFEPDQVLSEGVTRQELAARQFMTNHTMRHPEVNPQRTSHRYREKPLNTAPITRYAIKHLKHTLTSHPERFQRAALDLVLEGQLLLALDHPGIVSVRGWSYQGPNAYRTGKHSDYFLILDRLPETLETRIHEWRQQYCRYRRRLPWQRAKYTAKFDLLFQERIQVALDVASALLYLHDRRIINRDVKTANVGFDVHGQVKIFDFGLSRLLPVEEEAVQDGNYSMSRVGTKLYMAPEVREKRPYTLSADVYSFGIVLWEILALSTPKKSRDRTVKDKNDENGCWLPICPCWPTDLQELIRSCLGQDSSNRPSMAQICDTLQNYSVTAAVRRPCQRRRSTFRIDLSELSKEQDKLKAAALEHGSGESKTSRTSASTSKCDR